MSFSDINGLLKTLAVIVILIIAYRYAVKKGLLGTPTPASPPESATPVAPTSAPQDAVDLSWLGYLDPLYWIAKLSGDSQMTQLWNQSQGYQTATPAGSSSADYVPGTDPQLDQELQPWQGVNQ